MPILKMILIFLIDLLKVLAQADFKISKNSVCKSFYFEVVPFIIMKPVSHYADDISQREEIPTNVQRKYILDSK